jgi:hypothetical protein
MFRNLATSLLFTPKSSLGQLFQGMTLLLQLALEKLVNNKVTVQKVLYDLTQTDDEFWFDLINKFNTPIFLASMGIEERQLFKETTFHLNVLREMCPLLYS